MKNSKKSLALLLSFGIIGSSGLGFSAATATDLPAYPATTSYSTTKYQPRDFDASNKFLLDQAAALAEEIGFDANTLATKYQADRDKLELLIRKAEQLRQTITIRENHIEGWGGYTSGDILSGAGRVYLKDALNRLDNGLTVAYRARTILQPPNLNYFAGDTYSAPAAPGTTAPATVAGDSNAAVVGSSNSGTGASTSNGQTGSSGTAGSPGTSTGGSGAPVVVAPVPGNPGAGASVSTTGTSVDVNRPHHITADNGGIVYQNNSNGTMIIHPPGVAGGYSVPTQCLPSYRDLLHDQTIAAYLNNPTAATFNYVLPGKETPIVISLGDSGTPFQRYQQLILNIVTHSPDFRSYYKPNLQINVGSGYNAPGATAITIDNGSNPRNGIMLSPASTAPSYGAPLPGAGSSSGPGGQVLGDQASPRSRMPRGGREDSHLSNTATPIPMLIALSSGVALLAAAGALLVYRRRRQTQRAAK